MTLTTAVVLAPYTPLLEQYQQRRNTADDCRSNLAAQSESCDVRNNSL
jgi:hypothetical protein